MAVATGTAILGAAAVGAVSSAMASETSRKSAGKSQNLQKQAMAMQQETSTANLEFAKQQYDDWQAIYGPIQENLSSFYQQLSPETFTASGIQQYEQQFQQAQVNLQRSFAQRGIDSPAQDMLSQGQELDRARTLASIRTNAPMQVAQAQQGFLASSTGNPMAPGVSSAYGNQANILAGQADFYGNQANMATQQQAQAYNAMGQAVQTGFSQYAQNQQMQQLNAANSYNTQPGSQQTQQLIDQQKFGEY